jgi:hypothetical protein
MACVAGLMPIEDRVRDHPMTGAHAHSERFARHKGWVIKDAGYLEPKYRAGQTRNAAAVLARGWACKADTQE